MTDSWFFYVLESSIFNCWGEFSENPHQQSPNVKKISLYKTKISNASASPASLRWVGWPACGRLMRVPVSDRACPNTPTGMPHYGIAGIVNLVEVGYHWRWYEFLRLTRVMSLSVPVSLVSLTPRHASPTHPPSSPKMHAHSYVGWPACGRLTRVPVSDRAYPCIWNFSFVEASFLKFGDCWCGISGNPPQQLKIEDISFPEHKKLQESVTWRPRTMRLKFDQI